MITKGLLRSAGLAAGLLGLVALSPSAFAQSYWNGAPNATGPNDVGPTGPAPMGGPAFYGPNFGGSGPGYGAADAPAAGPFWLGAPNATGPSS
jgi:hypothetical protein